MKKVFSQDKKFYYHIHKKDNLYRIAYFLQTNSTEQKPEFAAISGTNSSVFDDLSLTEKEANRMLEKYESQPHLFF